jgi:hypothetical protein
MQSSKLSLSALLIVCSALAAKPLFAQQDTLPYKLYEVGLFGTGGVSVFNGTVPDGSKTDIRPAYTFGALGTYAANRDIGFALGLGYEARGMFFKEQNKTDPNETITLNYFSVQPSIRFKSFLLGVNIGIPLSGHVDGTTGLSAPFPSTYSADIGKDTLNTVIDIRAEGMLPIVENDFGNLYFIIQASYPLSDAIGKGGFLTPGQTTTTPVTKSPIPTVQLGLSYLFSPGAKTK